MVNRDNSVPERIVVAASSGSLLNFAQRMKLKMAGGMVDCKITTFACIPCSPKRQTQATPPARPTRNRIVPRVDEMPIFLIVMFERRTPRVKSISGIVESARSSMGLSIIRGKVTWALLHIIAVSAAGVRGKRRASFSLLFPPAMILPIV